MRRCGLLGIALAVTTLVFVPAAAAANPVPNPSFEDYCDPPGAPCAWRGGERDEDDPHSGFASLRVIFNELAVVDRAFSDCAAATVSAGQQSISLWYRTADTRTLYVWASVQFYSDAGCASGSYLGSDEFSQAATPDGEWQPAAGTVQVPANVQGVDFHLGGAAQVYPGDPPAPVNFDDVVLGAPTAVTVTRFRAERSGGGVRLRWHSASEVGIVAYEVLRTGPGRATRIVRGLVPAAGRPGAYRLVDRTARVAATYSYALRAVGADGTRTTLRTVHLAA